MKKEKLSGKLSRSAESSEVPSGHNPALGGYSGPRIVINPTTFHNKKDAVCVAYNEAFRVVMEENGFNPQSEPTDAQRSFFADTAYANDEVMLRRTILARICTFDTSVKDPTDEQISEAVEFLETVMQIGAPQSAAEQSIVQRAHDVLTASISDGGRAPEETEKPPQVEPQQEEPEPAEIPSEEPPESQLE